MNDYFKMFVIALVTTVASQLLLTPYIMKLHRLGPTESTPSATRSETSGAAAGASEETKLAAPNLEGMKVDEARERWRERGLAIIEDGERAGSGAEPGTIVSQRPAAGETLSSKEIRVVVAKESEDVQVPDVLGQPVDEARTSLVAAGFEVPDPKKEASDKEKGSVIRQIPNPGARAKSGSVVRLVVAEPSSIKVPSLRGMYLARAKKALDDAGLTAGKVRRVEDPERGENYVLRQDPAPGEKVPPGTEVTLTVVAPN